MGSRSGPSSTVLVGSGGFSIAIARNSAFRQARQGIFASGWVTVLDYPDGRLSIRYKGVELAYRTFDKGTVAKLGVRRPPPLAGVGRWSAGIAARNRCRACR